jgi:hypothetical protein
LLYVRQTKELQVERRSQAAQEFTHLPNETLLDQTHVEKRPEAKAHGCNVNRRLIYFE